MAVLGNHDHWADARLVLRVLRDGNLEDVGKGFGAMRRGGVVLHVAGVDDVTEGMDRLGAVLDALPGGGAAVLLAHEPDFADTSAKSGRFDLRLSGHSHGGQVDVPLPGPPVLPPFARKYPAGLYEVGRCRSTPTGCRPEITTFVLRAGK